MPKKIAVIDGNSLMHRAYHAVPATMNAPDGTPTNAAFGFLSMFLKFYEMARPDAVVCAFDAGRPAFRMEALEQYKAQRPPMDAELKAQFPVIEHLLESMNVPVIRVKGWEGDDVLGTVSARDEELGYETLLVSGDKDVYQLVTDRTHVVTTKKGITDVAIYGPTEVEKRYGDARAVPRLLGPEGRFVRQHSRRARHWRQDRREASAELRQHRRHLRQPRQAQGQAAAKPYRT